MSRFSRFFRWCGVLLAAATLLLLAFTACLLLPVIEQPDFLARKGELLQARQTGEWAVAGGSVTQLTLSSSSGLEVELALRLPREPLPGRPLLILLGGQETGRQAVDLLPDTRGVAVAALSYPFGIIPHREGLALALALPRIQRGILDTPAAAMLAADYLLARPDLDPERVELAGISFGAYLAAIPAALDTRIERLWLIHGSGDPQGVIEAGLRKRIPLPGVRAAIAWLLATTAGAHHLSPEDWVGRMAPRPVIVVNATEDSALTDSAVAMLHDALRPPSRVLWSPGDHVHPKRPETIAFIADLLFEYLATAGAPAADGP